MSSYTLYLARHGLTAENLAGRYIGWEDPTLSPEGLQQAEGLAALLQAHPIQAILSSDLRRALQTAEAIGRAKALPVTPHPGLREVHFGRFSGLTYDEIAARWPAELSAWIEDPERVAPPGGESLASLRARALAALPRQDGLLVVTHGGVIRALLAHLTGEPFWTFQPRPGSLTRLSWDGERCLGQPVPLYGTIVPEA